MRARRVDLERAFTAGPPERDMPLREIRGEIPGYLRGCYYRNGPARFRVGGLEYRHWLDGDGMVCRLAFSEDGVQLTQRYVQTPKWQEEVAAEGPIYRAFGTAFPGDRILHGVALASPVNVSVYRFAENLLAFGEQGLPWHLDDVSLESHGPWTADGRLSWVSPFSGHPKIDPVSGEMANFGVSFSPTNPTLTYYRFTRDGQLATRMRHALPGPYSIHDFALGPRHAVVYVSPYRLDMRVLRDGGSVIDSLRWEPERGSELLVIDRETGHEVGRYPVGHKHCLHLANTFEEGGCLVVDVIELERPVYPDYQPLPDLFREAPVGQPVRFLLDLASGLRERREIPYSDNLDFPSWDRRRFAQPYRDLWLLAISDSARPGSKSYDRLVRVDWQTGSIETLYTVPAGTVLGGEPVFVPDPGASRAGVVICPAYDTLEDRTTFLILDAFEPGEPRARLPLAAPLNLGFHASWVGAQR